MAFTPAAQQAPLYPAGDLWQPADQPVSPLAGPDLFDLPGLRNRKAQLLDMQRALISKLTGKAEGQPYVGDLYPADPPVR